MNKIINKIAGLLLLLTLFVVFTGTSFAATSVRLQQPQTQTYKDTFTITFVALDTNNSAINVQCQKKGPSDADFVNFGSLITLSTGGNTDACQVNSGIVNTSGTYQFRVVATGSETKTSSPVSVDFNNSTPGTPTNYSKTKPDSCMYKISFRSANDSGKTVKVVLYRSTTTSFSVDSSHQVNSTNIGSDTDGFMNDNVSSNCSTEYFYVIRAFDVYGNGSGVVGDSNVTTTIVNPTTTTTPSGQGAIPVEGAGTGQVLGEGTKATEKAVLGTESAKTRATEEVPLEKEGKNFVASAANWVLNNKGIALFALVVLGLVSFYLYRRFGKRVK